MLLLSGNVCIVPSGTTRYPHMSLLHLCRRSCSLWYKGEPSIGLMCSLLWALGSILGRSVAQLGTVVRAWWTFWTKVDYVSSQLASYRKKSCLAEDPVWRDSICLVGTTESQNVIFARLGCVFFLGGVQGLLPIGGGEGGGVYI